MVLARAVELAHKALDIAPSTAGPYNLLSINSLNERRFEEAIAAFERARVRNPKSPLPPAWLALTYADVGQMEQARAAAQEVFKVASSFSAKAFVNATLPYKDRAKPKRALATLLKIGLRE